ncbi:hypothetical protein [Virgibacillus siamensis]|uniref:hypothetical protein n=1 Tax=Virgibacillus siamensis TaxID=480071 RepID=UPI00158AE6EA|nr:hypothetical protein [Virgibacillus siamensis]
MVGRFRLKVDISSCMVDTAARSVDFPSGMVYIHALRLICCCSGWIFSKAAAYHR